MDTTIERLLLIDHIRDRIYGSLSLADLIALEQTSRLMREAVRTFQYKRLIRLTDNRIPIILGLDPNCKPKRQWVTCGDALKPFSMFITREQDREFLFRGPIVRRLDATLNFGRGKHPEELFLRIMQTLAPNLVHLELTFNFLHLVRHNIAFLEQITDCLRFPKCTTLRWQINVKIQGQRFGYNLPLLKPFPALTCVNIDMPIMPALKTLSHPHRLEHLDLLVNESDLQRPQDAINSFEEDIDLSSVKVIEIFAAQSAAHCNGKLVTNAGLNSFGGVDWLLLARSAPASLPSLREVSLTVETRKQRVCIAQLIVALGSSGSPTWESLKIAFVDDSDPKQENLDEFCAMINSGKQHWNAPALRSLNLFSLEERLIANLLALCGSTLECLTIDNICGTWTTYWRYTLEAASCAPLHRLKKLRIEGTIDKPFYQSLLAHCPALETLDDTEAEINHKMTDGSQQQQDGDDDPESEGDPDVDMIVL